jgi:disulfide bond formation protein DsbB
MTPFTETVNFIASLGTLTIGVIGIVALVLHGLHRKRSHKTLDALTKWLLWFGLLVSLSAIIGSLVYSLAIGYPPCELCWWQRIAIYPQVVLYAIALFEKNRGVFKYALTLSLIGVIIAIYHNYILLGGSSLFACDISNPCTAVYVNEFGFVTIPMMSLLSLLGLTAIAWIGLERNPQ